MRFLNLDGPFKTSCGHISQHPQGLCQYNTLNRNKKQAKSSMYNLYKFKPENVPDVKPDDYKRFISSPDSVLAIINPKIAEEVRNYKKWRSHKSYAAASSMPMPG